MKTSLKILLIAVLSLFTPLAFAVDLNSSVPSNFPKQKSTPKRYSSSATIQAFYDSWAENIGKDIQVKTFDTEFIDIGYGQAITNDVFPKVIIPKTA